MTERSVNGRVAAALHAAIPARDRHSIKAASPHITGSRILSPPGLRATSSISFTPATGTDSAFAGMPHVIAGLVASMPLPAASLLPATCNNRP